MVKRSTNPAEQPWSKPHDTRWRVSLRKRHIKNPAGQPWVKPWHDVIVESGGLCEPDSRGSSPGMTVQKAGAVSISRSSKCPEWAYRSLRATDFPDTLRRPMIRPRHLRRSCLVWLFAAMAMLGQIVGGAAMPVTAAADPFGVVCSVDHPAPSHTPGGHHHDCAACVSCAGTAVHAALISPAPQLPAPAITTHARAALPPPARAPPSWQFGQPYPRGPPAFA